MAYLPEENRGGTLSAALNEACGSRLGGPQPPNEGLALPTFTAIYQY